jgi:hypothetical protein
VRFLLLTAIVAASVEARADSTLPTTAEIAPDAATCRAAPPERWGGLVAQFTFAKGGERLSAKGELHFVERVARAKLDGKRTSDGWRLDGEMVEVGGLGTHWRLRIALRAGARPHDYEGKLFEMVDGEPTLMCSFVLRGE